MYNLSIEKNKFDLPQSVIAQEAEERLSKEKEEYEKMVEKNKDNKDFKEKFDEKEIMKKITESLTKSYSAFYLTEHIAEQNSISVSEEEVKQTITQEAIRSGADIDEMLKNVEKDDKLKNYIAFSIKEAKVFNYIYDSPPQTGGLLQSHIQLSHSDFLQAFIINTANATFQPISNTQNRQR